jgi:septum formation protein
MLENARVPFTSESPRLDETTIRESLSAESVSPRDQADALADLKAAKVAAKVPDAFVIGSDQILEHKGVAFGKPETPDALETQLTTLSGETHRLFSAVVVYEEGRPVWRHVGEVRLTMHPLTPSFIQVYVARNWESVRFSVGGYHIESEGIRLFSRITGSHFDILGLPLPELLSYLRSRKVLTT